MIQTSQMTLEEFNQGAERWRQQCLTYINALLLENKRNEQKKANEKKTSVRRSGNVEIAG